MVYRSEFDFASLHARKLSRINTYAKCAANPCGMRAYKIIGPKVSWNEHLQKNGGGAGLIVTQRPPATRTEGREIAYAVWTYD